MEMVYSIIGGHDSCLQSLISPPLPPTPPPTTKTTTPKVTITTTTATTVTKFGVKRCFRNHCCLQIFFFSGVGVFQRSLNLLRH